MMLFLHGSSAWHEPPHLFSPALSLLSYPNTLFHRSQYCQRDFACTHLHGHNGLVCVGCIKECIKPYKKDKDSDSVPHFPLGKTAPDAAADNSIPVLLRDPARCPDRLGGAKGSHRCFPLIPGVPHLPRHTKTCILWFLAVQGIWYVACKDRKVGHSWVHTFS